MTAEEHKVALACDIYENDDEYLVIADAPGVSGSGLDVTVHGDRLTVRGERSHGEARSIYERVFTLPQNADQGAVSAEARDGVVRLHIPKTADSKPRRIEVRTS
jgi:HSP20 family molecular chaperone IbpA